MLILSPRAVARLESYTPPWPLPKIFRMTKGGKLIEGIFEGETINTPSMLCVEDYIDALEWAKGLGGLEALIARADANAGAILDWVARTPWIANLARLPATASNTSVCLVIADPDVLAKGEGAVAAVAKGIAATLETEGVAFDIGAYRDAPPGLRIWCGATVERADLRGADAVARLGLRAGEGEAREGGLSHARHPGRAQRDPGPRDPDQNSISENPALRLRSGRDDALMKVHHAHSPRPHLRRPFAGGRPDLQGSRRRGGFRARARQGQGPARRGRRRL